MQVSFAGFPADISGIYFIIVKPTILCQSVLLPDIFFPFYHDVLFLWRRKSDAVAVHKVLTFFTKLLKKTP